MQTRADEAGVTLVMDQTPPNTTLPRTIAPGITFVVLLALALQAAAGVLEPGLMARHGHVDQARQVAEAVVRRLDRVVRKQAERPIAVRPMSIAVGVARTQAKVASTHDEVRPRSLGCHLLDLPPPSIA